MNEINFPNECIICGTEYIKYDQKDQKGYIYSRCQKSCSSIGDDNINFQVNIEGRYFPIGISFNNKGIEWNEIMMCSVSPMRFISTTDIKISIPKNQEELIKLVKSIINNQSFN